MSDHLHHQFSRRQLGSSLLAEPGAESSEQPDVHRSFDLSA
ncbi:hypothetical protein [Rhizobium leguminosarum]|nr:hypothetical protein [Rhizobium leguminosarum]